MNELCLAITTCGSREEALKLSREAVAAKLAACAQIESPITSVYVWEGKTEEDEEYRVTFKAPATSVPALKDLVHKLHSYDVPEWVVIHAQDVSTGYFEWARDCCR